MAEEDKSTSSGITAARGSGGADITGGTDKVGRGGVAPPAEPQSTGEVETGDITGASSTHAGAGATRASTGGVGTAPAGGSSSSTGPEGE